MSNAAGVIRKLIVDNTNIYLTNDIEVNFWQGGFVNTEALDDVNGSTPKTEFKAGKITGISSRRAAPGSVKALSDLLIKTTVGDVPMIVELASGEKYSGSVYAVVDVDSAFSNTEAKSTFSLHPRTGKFTAVS
jgi:hypothetical protein